MTDMTENEPTVLGKISRTLAIKIHDSQLDILKAKADMKRAGTHLSCAQRKHSIAWQEIYEELNLDPEGKYMLDPITLQVKNATEEPSLEELIDDLTENLIRGRIDL